MSIELTDKEVQILDSLYDNMSKWGHHSTHPGMEIVRDHKDVLDYFSKKLILTKQGYGDYRFTGAGYISLIYFEKRIILKTILKSFAEQYKNKPEWSREEIKEFIETQGFAEFDTVSVIKLGESLDYFECFYAGNSILPYNLKLQYNGKKYADNPINFLPDVDFDIRKFNSKYNDEEILK